MVKDGFPVSPGHLLVVAKRHVASWFDATPEEQAGMMALVNQARGIIGVSGTPDGFNIGINVGEAGGQTIGHLHVHVIPRFDGDVPDPRGGVRNVIPELGNYLAGPAHGAESTVGEKSVLYTGEGDRMLEALRGSLREMEFDRVDIVVSFVFESGLSLLAGAIEDAVDRKAQIRVLTTDYMESTEPGALAWLLDREEDLSTRVFKSRGVGFHPKSYIFWSSKNAEQARAFVGSSNISQSGLHKGVEWNLQTTHAREHRNEFERLWNDPRTVGLDEAFLEEYKNRRGQVVWNKQLLPQDEIPEPAVEVAPRPIQEEALAAIQASRDSGYTAGLVVMATGLGKTWLAAFDSLAGGFKRILFIAHREEILRQTRDVFRRVHSDASIGLFMGAEKDAVKDITLAGVQTLVRCLDRFSGDEFDYIVIDEFHHAAANSYRKVIGHFRPGFLIGLTATPSRMDGADLMSLCGDHEFFNCDLVEGIHRKELSPFEYHGLKDVADFKPIPWRNGKFDPTELTKALETQARAEQSLREWKRLGGLRTLGFCCSVTHAEFMAEYFNKHGVRAVAVHSKAGSAPRNESVDRLNKGELDILFSIDIFNEGLDVPAVDTVLMLRPTHSPVIFLQQLGRGLRISEDKEHLTVIDFIGNHHSFLMKPRTLLSLGKNGRYVSDQRALKGLDQINQGLPPGCKVEFELDVIELFRTLARTTKQDALIDFCLEYRELEQERPTATQAFHSGFSLGAAKKSGGWFGFLHKQELLDGSEASALDGVGDFLAALQSAPINKAYKLTTLSAMVRAGAFFDGMPVAQLAADCHQMTLRDPRLLQELKSKQLPEPASISPTEWERYWRKWPIAAWLGELASNTNTSWFELSEAGHFKPSFAVSGENRDAALAMIAELLEYRLAKHHRSTAPQHGTIRCVVSQRAGLPIIKLDSAVRKSLPQGDIPLLADGELIQATFSKDSIAVAQHPGEQGNALHSILRSWFGPAAGLAGSHDSVIFEKAASSWTMRPDKTRHEAQAGKGTLLPFFPSYKVACGTHPAGLPSNWKEHQLPIATPEDLDADRHFIAFAHGDSMDGGSDPIRHGDMLLFEWLRNVSANQLVAERTLVEYGEGETKTAALKIIQGNRENGFALTSPNPEYAEIPASRDFRPVARLVRKLAQSEFNPISEHLHQEFKRMGIAPLYGKEFNTGSWNAGHVSIPGHALLFITLIKSKGHSNANRYKDYLDSPDTLIWSSQASTSPESKKGLEIINALETGTKIHIWLRGKKSDVAFLYAGIATPVSWESSKPMSFKFRLADPLPADVYQRLRI